MVKMAKILAEATSALVNAIKLEAEAETDPDARRRLLDAAKALADATSKMVEAAKGAARNPNDEQAQEALRRAAEHLRWASIRIGVTLTVIPLTIHMCINYHYKVISLDQTVHPATSI